MADESHEMATQIQRVLQALHAEMELGFAELSRELKGAADDLLRVRIARLSSGQPAERGE